MLSLHANKRRIAKSQNHFQFNFFVNSCLRQLQLQLKVQIYKQQPYLSCNSTPSTIAECRDFWGYLQNSSWHKNKWEHESIVFVLTLFCLCLSLGCKVESATWSASSSHKDGRFLVGFFLCKKSFQLLLKNKERKGSLRTCFYSPLSCPTNKTKWINKASSEVKKGSADNICVESSQLILSVAGFLA